MKKLIAIGVIVALVIGLIASIPVFAKSQNPGGQKVFEAVIIDTCELDTLENGEVCFKDNGSYQVEVQGVVTLDQMPKTYDVYLLWGLKDDYSLLGQLTIDDDGNGIVTGYMSETTTQKFFPVSKVAIMDEGASMPPSCPDNRPQFVSGFQITP